MVQTPLGPSRGPRYAGFLLFLPTCHYRGPEGWVYDGALGTVGASKGDKVPPLTPFYLNTEVRPRYL